MLARKETLTFLIICWCNIHFHSILFFENGRNHTIMSSGTILIDRRKQKKLFLHKNYRRNHFYVLKVNFTCINNAKALNTGFIIISVKDYSLRSTNKIYRTSFLNTISKTYAVIKELKPGYPVSRFNIFLTKLYH